QKEDGTEDVAYESDEEIEVRKRAISRGIFLVSDTGRSVSLAGSLVGDVQENPERYQLVAKETNSRYHQWYLAIFMVTGQRHKSC
ncbi:hypothetical protein BIW11_04356, partial [Tropilaelaps mercedesae]